MRFLPVLFLLLPGAILSLYGQPILVLHDEKKSYFAEASALVLEDPERALTIDQVSSPSYATHFRTGVAKGFNYGYTTAGYWVRLRLQATTPSSAMWLLKVQNSALGKAVLYTSSSGDDSAPFHVQKASLAFPFEDRLVKHRLPVFELRLTPEETRTYYLYFAGDGPVHFPLEILSERKFDKNDHLEQLLQGIYFGLLIVMIFYNLFLYVSIKDPSYLYYLLYVASFGILQASMNGIAYEYLWPTPSWWADHCVPIFIATTIGFGSLFCLSFLSLKRNTPSFYRVFVALTGASVVLLLFTVLISQYITIVTATLLGLAFAVLVMAAAIVCLVRQYRPALFLLIAWSVLLLGIVLFALSNLGVLPGNFITNYGIQIGSALDVVLLSLALADRINILQQERMRVEGEKVQAEQSKKLKEEFLASVSHEIRTPMNAIIGFARLLEKAGLEGQNLDYARHIRISADNLLVIVNDVLDISKINSGKLRFERIEINLPELVRLLFQTVSFAVNEKNIRATYSIDERIPSVFLGDPVRLNQILLNLLSNAVKFTHQGEVSLSVHLNREEKQSIILNFVVKDTGIGIEADKLPTIFESYSQASRQTNRLYGGTGLGLTISKQLIELQGGTISVQSKLGDGTEFTISLPFSRKVIAPVHPVRPPDAQPSHYLGIRSILLVDDNAVNRVVAQHTLMHWRPEIAVATVESGQECLEKLRQDHYDLVLLDVQMPGMDGFQTARCIRKELPPPLNAVLIVALSAGDSPEDRLQARKAGMNDYLVKPFLADDLEKIIRVIPPDTGQPAPPKQNKFNLSHVEKASLGDQAFMAQLLNLFLDSTPESVGKMQSAAREENWDALGALAHKNRSIFTTLGLEDLTNQLERIETFSRGETDVNSENINILLRRFTGGYQRIFAEIREARDQLLITETKKE